MSKPKKVDNFTQGCTCDSCGKSLHMNHIWLWEEHFGCSRTCVEAEYFKARPELETKLTKLVPVLPQIESVS